jgi:uncharacterized membrane protein YfcA
MVLLGLAATFAAGATLGLLGGGGSVLVVPVLVYVFGRPPIEATAYSLVVVGGTSLAATFLRRARQPLPFRTLATFGVPSIAAAYLVRAALVPRLPELVTLGGLAIARDALIMLAFAGLTAVAGTAMLTSRRRRDAPTVSLAWAPAVGAATGSVTALLGAGGGFVVLPALTLVLGLPFERAIGASTAMVAAQSIAGAIGAVSAMPVFDVRLVVVLTATMLLGMAWGVVAGEHLSPDRLRRGFGWLLVAVAAAISIQHLG